MVKRLISKVYFDIRHDFLLLENGEHIVVLRRDGGSVVNTGVAERFGFDFENRWYEIRELPKFNLKEENPNGNDMDNRN